MARAPLPNSLPGEFFVIQYDREMERFLLILDDVSETQPQPSSYPLDNDLQKAIRFFKQRGLKEIGCRAIDLAKEFGMAQAILKTGVVIPDPLRKRPKVRDVFAVFEEKMSTPHLPTLSG